MLQTISPIFTDEAMLFDIAVRNGLAPASSVVGWNEQISHDAYFLSLAGIAPEAHVLDVSPHGMRAGLSLANHVRAGRYVAVEWLDAWVGFSKDLIAHHELTDVVDFRNAEPTEIANLGEGWDAIVLWDLPFRGDGSHVLQVIAFCIGLLKPGGCIAFQYRTPEFLEERHPARRGRLADGVAPEFGLQEANWMHWEKLAQNHGCRFEVIGKRLTPETKVAFIRK